MNSAPLHAFTAVGNDTIYGGEIQALRQIIETGAFTAGKGKSAARWTSCLGCAASSSS